MLQNSTASIYADGKHITTVLDNAEKLVSNAQQEFLNLFEWMRINKVIPKLQKTDYMVTGHTCKTNALHMPGKLIGMTTLCNYPCLSC